MFRDQMYSVVSGRPCGSASQCAVELFSSEVTSDRRLPSCSPTDLPLYSPLIAVFSSPIVYVHTDEAALTLENFNDVLYLAKKYMVDGLCGKVSSSVKENLDVSNIFDFLAASEVYAEYENICLDFIDENAEEVLNSDRFVDVDESRLEMILARDSLRATEIVVWYQTIHWAEGKLLSSHEEPSPEAIR